MILGTAGGGALTAVPGRAVPNMPTLSGPAEGHPWGPWAWGSRGGLSPQGRPQPCTLEPPPAQA